MSQQRSASGSTHRSNTPRSRAQAALRRRGACSVLRAALGGLLLGDLGAEVPAGLEWQVVTAPEAAGVVPVGPAVAGQQAHLAELTLLFAPNVNSFRRFLPDTSAPVNVEWGEENRTVGLRVPDHAVTQALLGLHGAPLLATTLIPKGEDEPLNDAEEIRERYEKLVQAVVDAGACPREPTTVVDLSEDYPEIVRVGAGDTSRWD
mgnify:CR=1 FL=1